MTNYKLISLNLCNDEDFIYGSDKLLIENIYDFIIYYNIVDTNLIDDILKLFNYFSSNINSNDTDLGLLNSLILSYYVYNNELRSITIKLCDKIRYITNYDQKIVDQFMTNKIAIFVSEVIILNPDFILLQDLDNQYLYDIETKFTDYNIISPLKLVINYDTLYEELLTNYILYKKTVNIKLIESYLSDCGTVGVFKINDKTRNIVSGKWSSIGRYQRIKQYKSLDKITESLIFMGDTNLRYNDLVGNESKHLYDVAFNEANILYTYNKSTNQYYNEISKFISRFDRIYLKDIVYIYYNLCFDKQYEILKSKYRLSGCISDHYGLIIDIID
jgi:hypothetical protein